MEKAMKCASCGHDAPAFRQSIDYDYGGQRTKIAVVCQSCTRCGTVSFNDLNAKAYESAVVAFQLTVDSSR